ncbi:LysM peptidoglycan-binding domain-containing protein [Brevibacterium marinum]|uniref:Nucleoid-associated protein YgaU n=1 Tax=Brevibacterium marinum TaxID=418643 RepID=A0A846S795_9MICO|nr:LysM domain-containing protein [Brevibacterium marinum]NJC57931.1 nucleoid-associated protein YgaU [Brevibacterium marinum]
MYLLISCTISWLCLLGAFITTWTALPAPRSTSDVAVIMVVGTSALLFSRHGLTSVLTLLIRLLPSGHLRTVIIRSVLRAVPTLLRSSVLAAVSASVAVHAGHASPLPSDGSTGAEQVATAPSSARAESAPDPGWPTAVPDDSPPDPGWPSVPPVEESTPPPDHGSSPEHDNPSDDATAPETDGSSSEADDSSSDADGSSPGADDSSSSADDTDDSTEERPGSPGPGHDDVTVHIVGAGESLWSIAASRASPDANTQDTVEQIYSANRDVIGANPNLIMPGQRLEIQP